MKKRLYIFISLTIVIVITGAWFFWAGKRRLQQKWIKPTKVGSSYSESTQGQNVRPASGRTPSSLADLYHRYQRGEINKDALITAGLLVQNGNPQNFYGKVIDQHGDPVVGADIAGYLTILTGIDSDERREVHKTKTDANGLFQFIDLRGASISADVAKQGYQIDYNSSYKLPLGGKTSPDNRAILTMWKLIGPEPMICAKLNASIPCDGSTTSFNLLTGKRGDDMLVKLTRNPVNIVRGKPFNWTLVIEIPNGGLLEQSDPYPNQAPTQGYQSSLTIDMPATTLNWSSHLTRSFYFKSRSGKNFGRMTIEIYADFQPPPTTFSALIYTNPAGSRNLEYDPTLRIDTK